MSRTARNAADYARVLIKGKPPAWSSFTNPPGHGGTTTPRAFRLAYFDARPVAGIQAVYDGRCPR